MVDPRKHKKYDALISNCRALALVRTAVTHPGDVTSLKGEIAEAKIIDPIRFGPRGGSARSPRRWAETSYGSG